MPLQHGSVLREADSDVGRSLEPKKASWGYIQARGLEFDILIYSDPSFICIYGKEYSVPTNVVEQVGAPPWTSKEGIIQMIDKE